MKTFIGYFDYLGFKDFVFNNTLDYRRYIMSSLFRDIEHAIAKGKIIESKSGLVADIGNSTLNLLIFSDTVVFWTQDTDINSLKELLAVTHMFNYESINFSIPVRGCIVYDEIDYYPYSKKNEKGGNFSVNSLVGKGLIHAYLKAEKQDWAGTVVDASIEDFLSQNGLTASEFLAPFAKKYQVPYKQDSDKAPIIYPEEYVFWLIMGNITKDIYPNYAEKIISCFNDHNKKTDNEAVQRKLENTLTFLKSFIVD